MRKFTQRVLLIGAAEMAIIGAVSGVDLVAQAHADPTSCIGASAQCQQVELTGPQSRATVVCQPTGPKAGAICREWAPRPA
ncbi:hypothetical protein GCM10009641_24690 [Mycobacterium cookii]|uniref:Uncharacterized protein n=1 Tax=Mycobacterium cookii TaxID=1775 RepID=A0A7I7KT63_9MYCO|nr:hypothetical protein [Mycobacterium cookii]MCV7331107.1 hypothetical protein [Mycobacterium cookii]BBX44939.1 hypothetical protein MCOO_09540 [Mycobacterium cookii]